MQDGAGFDASRPKNSRFIYPNLSCWTDLNWSQRKTIDDPCHFSLESNFPLDQHLSPWNLYWKLWPDFCSPQTMNTNASFCPFDIFASTVRQPKCQNTVCRLPWHSLSSPSLLGFKTKNYVHSTGFPVMLRFVAGHLSFPHEFHQSIQECWHVSWH